MKPKVGDYIKTIRNSAIGNNVIAKVRFINYEDRLGFGKFKNYYSCWQEDNSWFELTDNNPNTRYYSAIKIDNDNNKDSWLCRTLCFSLENMSVWCNDLDQLELDFENIKNSYIAFKQKIKELMEANLVVKVEE